MYLTQDMEPVEQATTSPKIETLDKLLLPYLETKEELITPDEFFDEGNQLNQH